jgi:amino acid transporter
VGAVGGTRPVDTSAADPAHLSEVISHAVAPAFLLGAVSGFVAVLMGRMNGILDRIRTLNAITDEDDQRLHLKADLPRLRRRARLVNDALLLAVGSAISTTLLVTMAFVSAFFGFRHEPGAGFLFIIALALMCGSLIMLAREVRIALTEFDHHA